MAQGALCPRRRSSESREGGSALDTCHVNACLDRNTTQGYAQAHRTSAEREMLCFVLILNFRLCQICFLVFRACLLTFQSIYVLFGEICCIKCTGNIYTVFPEVCAPRLACSTHSRKHSSFQSPQSLLQVFIYCIVT